MRSDSARAPGFCSRGRGGGAAVAHIQEAGHPATRSVSAPPRLSSLGRCPALPLLIIMTHHTL